MAPDAVTADSLATACIVLGAKEALAMLERVPEAEGLVVVNAGSATRVMATSKFDGRVMHGA